MSDHGPVGRSYSSLTDEQRQIITDNILACDALLGDLVDSVTHHLTLSHANCIRCCIGEPTIAIIHDATPEVLMMLLTMAVRELAQQRYDKTGTS